MLQYKLFGKYPTCSVHYNNPTWQLLEISSRARPFRETIKTNFLNCAICFELYRDPRALPCQHSFCRECLEQCVASSEDKQTLICPTCRREVNISTVGVKDLPVHFLVSSLKDTVDMEQQEQKPSPDTTCSNCDDSNSKAIVRCLDCKQDLCDKCYAPHNILKTMRNHKVVTMKDILSGKVNLSAEEENICNDHGQTYRYYCKDEKKAICQDCVILKKCPTEHDRITIDEAAQPKADELEGLVKTSDETLKKYQKAVKEIDAVEKELEIHSQIAKDVLAKVEQEYINLVKRTVKRFKDEIDKIQKERIKEIAKKKTNLVSTMKDIKKTNEDATKVIKSESKMSILSSHANLSTQLQKLSKSQPDTAYKVLGHVKFEAAIPAIPTIGQLLKDKTTANRWKLIGQFSTGEFNKLCGLALDPDDNIVVCSLEKGVKVFSRNGQIKSTLYDSPGSISVGVLPASMYVTAPRGTAQLKICDASGKKATEIPIKNVDNELSSVNSLTVDTANKIIVGQVLNTISIHKTDGSLISKFATQSRPCRLEATSNGDIVSSFLDAECERGGSAQLVDYSGANVRVIQPPGEIKVWSPGFVCCRQGEIFVSNSGSGDPRGVYRYTSEGDYLGCVTTEISNPAGIALSKDGMELFVADRGDSHIKIFQR